MKALGIVGIALICGVLGMWVGMAIGDRKSQYMDFGAPVLFGAAVGAIVGGFIGVVIGSVVFT